MGRIIIAGQSRELRSDIKVVSFADDGGLSFYTGKTAPYTSVVRTSDEGPLEALRPRKMPNGQFAAGLGGLGWDAADKEGRDPIKALSQVVRQVVLHHDAAVSARSCHQILLARGYSTHFAIDKDGTIYQVADVADQAIHATVMNSSSIGIDLNNPSPLLQEGAAPVDDRPVSKKMEINGSEFVTTGYTDLQYVSIIELLREICTVLGILPTFPVDENGKILNSVLQAPKEFNGIMCHWHVQPEKWDPGPGLDWERIMSGLRREDATLPAIPAGIADQLTPEDRKIHPADVWKTDEAAQKAMGKMLEREDTAARFARALCRTCEVTSGGGYYPMGVNQTWHSGIHIPMDSRSLVRPILKGEVVAAHLVRSDQFPEMGSNNFVLLRHKIELPARVNPSPVARKLTPEEMDAPPPPPNILTVYSLYMHLDGVDLDNPPEDVPLYSMLKSHSGAGSEPPEDPPGPMMSCKPIDEGVNQYKALAKGYVGLFSHERQSPIVVDPGKPLGYAGEFGEPGEQQRMVHVEVFADPSFLLAMELGLYGRYLELGAIESESMDLVVRSKDLLALLGEPPVMKDVAMKTDKVLTADAIREFFETDRDEQDALRKRIVRHVSEWSDQVDWVASLFANQDQQKWAGRLGGEGRWVFTQEVRRYLPYLWLDAKVAQHIGLEWDRGLVSTFHPINFVMWWMFLRSAVRGSTLEGMLSQVGKDKVRTMSDVADEIGEIYDMTGRGEWEY